MRKRYSAVAGLAAFAATTAALAGATGTHGTVAVPTEPPVPRRAASALPALPARFEPNLGQAAPAVRMVAHAPWGRAHIAADGAVVPDARGGTAARMRFAGADAGAAVVATHPLPGRSHYLLGRERARWVRGVPQHGGAIVRGAWPGIDVVWRRAAEGIAFDLVVAPGADPLRAALSFDGARGLRFERDGGLRASFPSGDLVVGAPRLHQNAAGGRRVVDGRFARRGDGTVGFEIGAYDRAIPLVIDPALAFARALGGVGQDWIEAVALGPDGEVHLAGYVVGASSGRATEGAAQEDSGGDEDAFLLALSADGSTILHATYLGGAGRERAFGIAVDAEGAATVVGMTASSDFPVASAIDSTLGATWDGFVARVTADGSDLDYATYLGGSDHSDAAYAVALHGRRAVVVGQTSATDFPVASPLQAERVGTTELPDAIIAILSEDGTALEFSTFLGGGSADTADAVAVDADGAILVAGHAGWGDFPTTAGVVQPGWKGGGDAWVARIEPGGTTLDWCTFLGGSGSDNAAGIAVDARGAVTVTGATYSTDFPTHLPIQAQKASAAPGGSDGWVARLTPSGAALEFSTYLGGAANDLPVGVGVDATGAATIVLLTESTGLPVAHAQQPAFGGGAKDAYLVRLAPDGRSRTWATYLGGSTDEYPTALVVTPGGTAVVVGSGGSSDYPWTVGTAGPFAIRLGFQGPSLTAALVGIASVRLDWVEPIPGADAYRIERRAAAGPWEDLGDFPGLVRLHVDTGLASLTTYTYRVFGVRGGEDSLPSNEASVTTLRPLPPAPGGVQAALGPGRVVHLQWEDAGPEADEYEILRSCDGGHTFVLVATVTGTEWDDPLPADRDCAYRVRARNTAGTSAESASAGVSTEASLLLVLHRGRIDYRPGEDRDSLRADLRFRFEEGASLDGEFDPVGDGLDVRLGSWEDAPVLSIPPGDDRWRGRRRLAWSDPRDAVPRRQVRLDPRRGTLVVSVSRADLGAPRANPVRLLVQSGDEAGSVSAEWRIASRGFGR